MRTELIIFHRPNNGLLSDSLPLGTASTNWTERNSSNYGQVGNPNQPTSGPQLKNKAVGDLVVDGIGYDPNLGVPLPPVQDTFKSGTGQRIDLYDDVDIPITYNILDISDPDKRKTAWSKTITVPGTKANNRTFKHIYQISGDGWIKIGNTSIYQNFNPNIRTEIVLLSDGIQVLKGNLQLKTIKKDANGNIEYEISLTGDLTSLFFDVGNAKLNDLDFTEWDHEWNKTNVMNSWTGLLSRSGGTYSNISNGSNKIVKRAYMDPRGLTAGTGRLTIETTTSHGFQEGDFVRCTLAPNGSILYGLEMCNGTWVVAEVISNTIFQFNTPFPIAMNGLEEVLSFNPPYGMGNVFKVTHSGRGYVYPLVQWGDEYDYNSFPVVSMVPSYHIKEIWDKIFDKTNSKYQSSFLTSEFFKRLIITQKKTTYEVSSAEIRSRSFFVGGSNEYTVVASKYLNQWAYLTTTATSSGSSAYLQTGTDPTTTPQTYPFFIDGGMLSATQAFYDGVGATGLGPGGNWNTSTYKWNVQKSGDTKLNCVIGLESWVDLHSDEFSYPTAGTAGVTTPSNATLYVKWYAGNDSSWLNPGGGPLSITSYHPYMKVDMVMKRKKLGNITEAVIGTTYFEVSKASGAYVHNTGSPMTPISPANNYWPYFGRYKPTSWNHKRLEGSWNGYVAKGEEIWIEVRYYICAPSAPAGSPYANLMHYYWKEYTEDPPSRNKSNCKWYLRAQGVYTPNAQVIPVLYNTPSPKSTEGSDIYGREFLPKDLTCKDFLKNIIKMFNLHIEPDRQIERLYYIEPRDDYYYTGSNGTSDYTDWTDKMDADTVEIIPMGQLLAKNYVFQNKAETDYWNKRFKDERGRDYMSYTKEIDNDFLKNDFKIDVSFGSTVMINNPTDSDVVLPSVIQKEASGSTKPVSNSAPRVLLWVGMRPYSTVNANGIYQGNNTYPGWDLVSDVAVLAGNPGGSASVLRQYPYAGTVDSPKEPFYDLNWFNMEEGDFVYWNSARWTNHNLYNAYWKNFIDEVSDPASMVVKADFNLSASDIFDLDFRRIFVVDGVYYRLQKVIDYNPVKDGMTKVELLKLKQPTRFTRRSIWNSDVFEYVHDVTRPLTTTTVYAPPRTKNWAAGSYVNNLPQSLGNGTIQVSGKANNVMDGKNITITGNENEVGFNSENININGSGVVVASGLYNVNVIGTDNVHVKESNVSYINGVRYKNGVAVSRCNIIDAGETGATASTTLMLKNGSNINTNITVVDAGEDLVSFTGTNTHETIIDSGQDAILPDLVELGLTTRTTPNPKTNYTGGAVIVDGYTASIAEIVRANRISREIL